MEWQSHLRSDSLAWLVQSEDAGVRYLAMRDLLNMSPGSDDMLAARRLAHTLGPISRVLNEMKPEGYWSEPGPGYNPKYFSSVWSLILLAQLGASPEADSRMEIAVQYILDHALSSGGQFTSNGVPSGTADCLQGNLCWALSQLGCKDPRLEMAFEWLARSVTGDGVAPSTERNARMRYYAGKCGPLFACGSNNKSSCAWGAAKVMLAFASLPAAERSPFITTAVDRGVEFLFSVEPVTAAWPSGLAAKPSLNWWKFGFPVFYVTDLLQIVEALALLGYGTDQRLSSAIKLILEKQDDHGRWQLDYDYTGKTWVEFGPKKQPNPWVTLRVLKVLKLLGQ